jgi:hypothetical protein
MAFAHSNPDLLARHYRRANRWALWRAQPGESLFQLFALLLFGGFALWVAEPLWTAVLAVGAPWATWITTACVGGATAAALWLRATRALRLLADSRHGDWLAAMPLTAERRAQARYRELLGAHLTVVLLAASLLLWASLRATAASPELRLMLVLGLALGALLGASQREQLPRLAPASAATGAIAAVANIAASVRGLALLGAALEPASARLPKTAPWVAGSFLLFPQSTPIIAIPALILLFTALSSVFDRISEWRQRYLADQLWLAAQPLAPRRLFLAYLPFLLRRIALWSAVFGVCVYSLRAPALFALVLALLLASAAADMVLCGFATRRNPPRFKLLLAVHGVVLLTTTQVLPPALPLVFIACAWSAWRQGHA